MATITSAATGNWSAGATWIGGVPPTSADDAIIGAGHTVTLDVDATVLTLSGVASTTSNLAITTSRTLICTGANGITAKSINSGLGLVRITGVGITVNINSVLRGTNSAASSSRAVSVDSICIVNIVGNVLGNVGASGSSALTITAAAVVTVNGDVLLNPVMSVNASGIIADSGCTLTITGNVLADTSTANSATAIRNATSACTINITGNVTAGVATALTSTQNSTITVVGTITANTNNVAINMSSGNITISTPCLNATNGIMAVFAPTVKIYSSAIASWRFATDVPATNKFLYSAGVALGNPVIADVRNGTVYGASNELTGTLIVPSPSNVVSGVPTDNTTGTYTTTPALIATEIFTKLLSNSDFNTSGSFGKLMKDNVDAKSSDIKAKTDLIPTNPASVQSVGAIVASYNV